MREGLGAEAQLLKLIEINWVLGWVCGTLPTHWLGLLLTRLERAWWQKKAESSPAERCKSGVPLRQCQKVENCVSGANPLISPVNLAEEWCVPSPMPTHPPTPPHPIPHPHPHPHPTQPTTTTQTALKGLKGGEGRSGGRSTTAQTDRK